tara:strand:+ start:18 stop:566 length:549 start_codon:yes stop_codon:yes gene_type:complete
MIQFYKPNAKMTGSACQFYLNNKDGSFFSTLIKQASWDANKKTGSFQANKNDPTKNVIIKFSPKEIAGILDAMERNVEYKGYHRSAQQTVQFTFGPYVWSGEQKGFSYSVSKQGNEDTTQKASFLIGFYFDESKLLKLHLEFLLNKHFEIEDKKNAERQAQYDNKEQQNVQQVANNVEDEAW